MPILFYLAFVVAALIAIFAVQNSSADPVLIKFLFWEFKTSLVSALLGAVCTGIVLTLLFWLQRSIRKSRRMKQKDSPGQKEEKRESNEKLSGKVGL
jgi:uncharacterized integral membrane protein